MDIFNGLLLIQKQRNKYITEDGKYIENIEYFSRDDSKVGLTLEFDYDVINREWNHKGFSSQGDPLHEIWVKRK